jgi:hypothetical protein
MCLAWLQFQQSTWRSSGNPSLNLQVPAMASNPVPVPMDTRIDVAVTIHVVDGQEAVVLLTTARAGSPIVLQDYGTVFLAALTLRAADDNLYARAGSPSSTWRTSPCLSLRMMHSTSYRARMA